ncbi:nonstructural protein [Microviridae sp.]|nr:nonstructural protein [Microviridae sp.]
MKTNMYTIYDNKAKVYNKPFYMLNNAVAERTALDLLADPNSELARHPEDFVMFFLGSYDDLKATFKLEKSPVPLFRFHELQRLLDLDENATAPEIQERKSVISKLFDSVKHTDEMEQM